MNEAQYGEQKKRALRKFESQLKEAGVELQTEKNAFLVSVQEKLEELQKKR